MSEVVVKNVVDRTFADITSGTPWTVHAEWMVDGWVDVDRLGDAATATMRSHPLLNARQGPSGDAWVVPDAAPRPCIGVTHAADDDAVAGLRSELVSQGFDLEHEPPVRFHVIRAPNHDHVMAVADHALVDGVGIGRVVVSLMSGYDTGWNGSVDEQWREAHALAATAPSPQRIAATVRARRSRVLPTPVRLARERNEDHSGYGVAYHEVSAAAIGTLTSTPPERSTTNDVVVAAFCMAGMAWNRDHGVPALPFSVGVPLNLRPARGWLDGVCNATLPWPVRIESEEAAETLWQVSDQLRSVRAGLYSPDVRALLAHVGSRTTLPVWVRHSLATTTVVSTVPGSEAARAELLRRRSAPSNGGKRLESNGLGRSSSTRNAAVRLYGGSPAPPTMGMTFAVMPDRDAYRFSARFLLSHHSQAGASRFLSSVDDAIVRLWEALAQPASKVVVA